MRRAHALLAALLLVYACGDDDDGPAVYDAPLAFDARTSDAPAPDARAADAGPTKIEELTLGETRALAGLVAEVDVVRDRRGVPHIYGRSQADVLRVQGYLMARDRFP